jgi:Lysine-specific metallo-endopeptidase
MCRTSHVRTIGEFIGMVVMALLLSLPSGAEAEEPPCQGNELTVAEATLREAKTAIDKAVSVIDKPSNLDLRRLETWLGIKSSSEATGVRDKLVRTRAFIDGVVFLCAVKTDVKIGDVYAYVRPDKSFVIVLGSFFFSAPESGFSSKLGILVHEMTHFTLAGATKDPKIYGIDEAKKLAKSSPASAQQNAENFEYFVESVAFNL